MLFLPHGRNAGAWLPALLVALFCLLSMPLPAAISFTVIDPPNSSAGNADDTSIPVAIDGENLIGAYFTASGNPGISGFIYNATTQAFVDINVPGASSTNPYAILGSNVVGGYIDSNGDGQGFLYNNTGTGSYTPISGPSASFTECLGLSAQWVVGTYTVSSNNVNVQHGFLCDLSGQSFTPIDYPSGATMTQCVGISGNDVVGDYTDSNGTFHGFLYDIGTHAYTQIDPLGNAGAGTFITAISGNVVVGYYEDSSLTSHGFLYDVGTHAYTTIAPLGPTTPETYVYAISGNDVVGSYDDSNFTSHGFLYDVGTHVYTTINPSGSTFTACHGVSNGLVAGQYADGSGNSHYFIASMGSTTGGGTGTTAAKVVLGGLAATYNGSPHAVTVTTTPAGLSTSVTYNGSADPPAAAGRYPVVATVTTAGYTGTATGTLVIAQAKATVALSALTTAYNGSPQAATATTNPPGLAVALTYAGDSAEPLAAGKYAVVATITDPNYTGSAKGTFVINKATAQVLLGNLTATYDGSAHAATGTTTPSGLGLTLTYNRVATQPVNAGSYAVVGTISDPNYTGSATGTLVIAKAMADVTLTLSSLTATYTGKAIAAVATTMPASLPLTYAYTQNGKKASPVNAGSYVVTATVNTANAAGSATDTLTINPAPATVTINSVAKAYTGAAIRSPRRQFPRGCRWPSPTTAARPHRRWSGTMRSPARSRMRTTSAAAPAR